MSSPRRSERLASTAVVDYAESSEATKMTVVRVAGSSKSAKAVSTVEAPAPTALKSLPSDGDDAAPRHERRLTGTSWGELTRTAMELTRTEDKLDLLPQVVQKFADQKFADQKFAEGTMSALEDPDDDPDCARKSFLKAWLSATTLEAKETLETLRSHPTVETTPTTDFVRYDGDTKVVTMYDFL